MNMMSKHFVATVFLTAKILNVNVMAMRSTSSAPASVQTIRDEQATMTLLQRLAGADPKDRALEGAELQTPLELSIDTPHGTFKIEIGRTTSTTLPKAQTAEVPAVSKTPDPAVQTEGIEANSEEINKFIQNDYNGALKQILREKNPSTHENKADQQEKTFEEFGNESQEYFTLNMRETLRGDHYKNSLVAMSSTDKNMWFRLFEDDQVTPKIDFTVDKVQECSFEDGCYQYELVLSSTNRTWKAKNRYLKIPAIAIRRYIDQADSAEPEPFDLDVGIKFLWRLYNRRIPFYTQNGVCFDGKAGQKWFETWLAL